ncbi:helix-turn-helix domain-containing protein [Streptomyces sp. NPDC057620]|uniref:helix-turn-helix domain-containing protein n=1 Tax=Streptomyces sp. NPDC057620 TaxID=3346185 RepID=UPI00369529DC
MHASEQSSSNLEMFGSLLRFFRERAGMTQEGLGGYAGYSKSQVAMVERGERAPKGKLVEIADETLSAQGALLAAARKLKTSPLPAWTATYAEIEAEATALHTYANHVVPGLLQTEAYAQVAIGCNYPPLEDEEIEEQVAARLVRQRLFQRRPTPALSFVLEQIALTRPIGGRHVLGEQLRHILEVGRRRNVEIQVMPSDRETHSGLNGPMILLETEERRQLAYVEGQDGGYFVSEQPSLGDLVGRYGILRAQALTPEESAKLIEQVAHEL